MRTEIIKTFVTVNKSNENTKGNSVESLSTKHVTITFLDLDKINISLKQPNTVVSSRRYSDMMHSLIQDSAVDVTFWSVFVGRK